MTAPTRRSYRPLDILERLGNRLPDPAMLFIIGALAIMALSQAGAWLGWQVTPVTPRRAIDPDTGRAVINLVESGEPLRPVSLLDSDGLYWAISSMVKNFIEFPPLGVILVSMLGVGLAERTGLIAAALKAFMLAVPRSLLTPSVVFIGIMSSVTTDAGFIVLPPLAAALYKAAGRSPLAGVAAVFAGCAGGFNANLLITSLDAMLSTLSTSAARIVDPHYTVQATANWYFMACSTFLLTLVGWAVTSWVVEKRFLAKPPEEGGPGDPAAAGNARLSPDESAGLLAALAAVSVVAAIVLAAVLIPGSPLYGAEVATNPISPPRWVKAIVPFIFFGFAIPGIAYGVRLRTVASARDVARLMSDAIASMSPVIVVAFFAAQFISYFKHSGLDVMLAMSGGKALASSGLPPEALVVALILVTMAFDMVITSMSAKYTLLSPIFVPMLMMVGVSPELTQCAYRIGDSVTNTITPVNAYLIIILAVMQRYAPRAGLGTLTSMMAPYCFTFAAVWIGFLVLWMWTGTPLGPDGPLWYTPAE